MSPEVKDKNATLKELFSIYRERFIDDPNRMPYYGSAYVHPKSGKKVDASWRPRRRPEGNSYFTDADLEYHFTGDEPDSLLGAYSIDADGNCKVGAVDIDGSHGRDVGDAAEKDMHAVDQLEALLAVLSEFGVPHFTCTSKSGTGYHVRVCFEKPTPAPKVRRLMHAMCRLAKLPENTEVYPKQDWKSQDGSLLALPGSHWWCAEAKRRGRGTGSWILDAELCPLPFEEWPKFLRALGLMSTEMIIELEKRLEEIGQKRLGKSPFELKPPSAKPPSAKPQQSREPIDATPGDSSYTGWYPSDMEDFLSFCGIAFEKKSYADGYKYVLDRCPWSEEHSGQKGDGSATFIYGSGALDFKCHHEHCAKRKWAQFKERVAPGGYKRRERPYGGKKIERIYSSSQLRAEAKKKRLAELEEAARARAALRADLGSPSEGGRGFASLGAGVSAATAEKIAASSERMREPGEDEDVALEEARAEAEAERLRQARFEHRKKYVLSRAWREHVVATSRRERYGLYSSTPQMGEVDPETGEALRPDYVTDEQGAKVDELNVAHQHTRSCRAITKGMVGKSGKKVVVPYACDRSGCCVQCGEEISRDNAEWAHEHWEHELVTLVEARNDEFAPRTYKDVESLRRAAEKVVKLTEKGPKKPRKKRKKKGESLLGAATDAALAAAPEPEVAEKKKFPRRYVNGLSRSITIGTADLHEAIGARYQPGGPKTAAGYAGDVVKCSESYNMVQVTSRLVTKAEAIRILFGHEVGEDGKTDPTQFADWKSVWMEPSVELLARDRAGEAHLRTPCPSDPDGEAEWEAELDRLTLRCFAHPYVQTKKKKRTSGNGPGKVAFSLPSPAELRAWKLERRIRENPELANEPDEEYKDVEVRYYGKLIYVVHDFEGKERWQCSQECHEALKTHLSRLGKPGLDIDAENRAQAAFVPPSAAEMFSTQRIPRMRPAHGCVPATTRGAIASAG